MAESAACGQDAQQEAWPLPQVTRYHRSQWLKKWRGVWWMLTTDEQYWVRVDGKGLLLPVTHCCQAMRTLQDGTVGTCWAPLFPRTRPVQPPRVVSVKALRDPAEQKKILGGLICDYCRTGRKREQPRFSQ